MKRFAAFISYSRKDKTVADWLHSKLEHYPLPENSNISSIYPFQGKYFRPVFLDTQDLHVERRPFTEPIRAALENSAFLIVLCSKNSAASEFVDKEIKYFLQTHDNNYSRIVPLFIDEVDGSIPPALQATTIMERHFPIYNSRLDRNSEANSYCFYQIIAYILNIDFSTIYNRYEVYAARRQKAKKRRYIAAIVALAVVLAALTGYHIQYKAMSDKALAMREQALAHKQNLIEFEKRVFPAAVVFGYEKNFLTPVINHLKKSDAPFKIYVLMPRNERDMTHADRAGDFAYNARTHLGIDSIPFELLPTTTRRGSRVMRLYKDGKPIEGIYVDFATTTTSFLQVATYKQRHRQYKHTPLDSLIEEYSTAFVAQTNHQLKGDSAYVSFYFDKDDMIEALRNHIK